MLNADIKRQIDSARNILVGKVPDPKAQVEQITTALIYKFMDDMDRENIEVGLQPQFFIKEYKEFAWSKLMDSKMSGQSRLDLYVQAIAKMPQNPYIPQLFRDIFKGAFLPFRDARTLNLFLKEINNFQYDHSENLGNAFEYLLSILGSQGDAGQFRTPRHIIDFIVSIIEPKKHETILDPACGTAGFLISSFKHILKTNSSETKNGNGVVEQGETATETIIADKKVYTGDLLSPDEKIKLTKNINGYDISPDMVKLALVNLYLHGFKEPQIYEYDTLSDEKRWDEDYDVILANPPFMTPKGGITPHKRFSVQARRSEVLFVDYIAEHLKIGGRAGIIVPEGIIFQASNAYKSLRKNLIENWGLWAVISLPSGVFQPYSGVKTSILILDKALAKHNDEILFVKVENDGFDLGAQRRKIDKNDLPQALEILKQWKETKIVDDKSKQSMVLSVKKSKIAENGEYNLTSDRYRKLTIGNSAEWTMTGLEELELEKKIHFLRGQGLSKKDIDKDGQYKCIHYGEIYTMYQPLIKEVVSRTNFKGKILSIKGDVLVPSTTTADAMGIAVARSLNEDGVILGGDINIIRTNNETILSDYLALLISNPPLKKVLASYAKGVNILHISNKDLRTLKFPLPPLEVQEQIVAEIKQYQKVIDGAKQVIENWKPSFRIDPNWNTQKVNELCTLVRGSSPRPKGDPKYYGGNVPRLMIADVTRDGMYTTPKTDFLTFEGAKKSRPMKKGEVVMAVSGNPGLTTILSVDACIHDGFVGFRDLSRKIIPEFLYFILLLKQSSNNNQSVGAVFKNLNTNQIKQFDIPVPSISIQKKIIAVIEDEIKVVEECKKLTNMMENKIEQKIGEVWGEK
jgi:type I restriction enzyme M protein